METTQHTPADVRERVVDEIVSTFRTLYPHARGLVAPAAYAAADRILALLRTPRGEGEAKALAWRVEYRQRGVGDARWYHLSTYANEMDARERAKHAEAAMRVLECRIIPLYASPAAALRSDAQGEEDAVRRTWELAVRRAYGCLDYRGGYRGAELEAFHAGIKTVIRALEAGPDAADTQAAALDRIGAALRSEANGKEADALDMIRWAESHGAALEPVAGNLTPPGTYACYVEGVGDDPAEYEDAGEPYMGPGILGAIRAARRGEGGGE